MYFPRPLNGGGEKTPSFPGNAPYAGIEPFNRIERCADQKADKKE